MNGIRTAVLEDAAAILAIYAPYILNTSITFEYEVPTLEEFTARIDRIRTTHPYLVYEEEGKVIGYAYATKFRERAAYQWDAELSVYLNQECRGRGVGRKLYSALIEALKKQNIQTVYGIVTTPNERSEKMHHDFDFDTIGILTKTGYKFGKWHDVVMFEKHIGSHENNPKPITLPEVK